ncbi:MAG: hypothetical protein LBT40_11980 [Deltaproteobacteria bacterium]|jgi:hypothetical protein|nr:hypothetical protein [Deltaproteobacteria bacterium]
MSGEKKASSFFLAQELAFIFQMEDDPQLDFVRSASARISSVHPELGLWS